jgi:hypothetical protein
VIAEVHHQVRRHPAQVPHHGLERRQISVSVGENGDAHDSLKK